MPVITAEAKFTDASHKVTQKLENTINEMCLQIPGFFGRMDVMYNSFAELENGKTSLLELNGAARPTHIYDPKHSLFLHGRN
jgi:hypothetical protein